MLYLDTDVDKCCVDYEPSIHELRKSNKLCFKAYFKIS